MEGCGLRHLPVSRGTVRVERDPISRDGMQNVHVAFEYSVGGLAVGGPLLQGEFGAKVYHFVSVVILACFQLRGVKYMCITVTVRGTD